MDRAEAIERLEWLRMVGNHVDSVTLGSEDMGYFDMAIAALREQEQREQGCEYCREYKSIVEQNGDFISLDATLAKGIFLEACTCDVVLEAKVPFCPMCGRKLPEPPKEGAEG